MELINFTPKATAAMLLPHDEPILLLPTADWQYGAEGFRETNLCQYFEDARMDANGHRQVMFTLGDMVDRHSPSGRAKIEKARFYDSTTEGLDAVGWDDLHHIVSLIRKAAPEVQHAGFLSGHHYHQFEDRGTTDTKLANEFSTAFLGDCAVLQFHFGDGDDPTKTINIWLHHGNGSGSPMTKLKKQSAEMENIDVFLMGHTPHIETKLQGRSYPNDTGGLKHRQIRLAGTGGWLSSYLPHHRRDGRAQGNYPEQDMLPPVPIGGIKIWLKPWTRGGERGVRVEVVT